MKKPFIKRTFRIDKEQDKAIKKQARVEKISESEVVRKLVDDYLIV